MKNWRTSEICLLVIVMCVANMHPALAALIAAGAWWIGKDANANGD